MRFGKDLGRIIWECILGAWLDMSMDGEQEGMDAPQGWGISHWDLPVSRRLFPFFFFFHADVPSSLPS